MSSLQLMGYGVAFGGVCWCVSGYNRGDAKVRNQFGLESRIGPLRRYIITFSLHLLPRYNYLKYQAMNAPKAGSGSQVEKEPLISLTEKNNQP